MVKLKYIGSHQPNKEIDVRNEYKAKMLVEGGEYEYVNKNDRNANTGNGISSVDVQKNVKRFKSNK